MRSSQKIEKALAVKASAGSGKTTDLTKRIIDLLHHCNGNILAVTFTNDAAQEMYNRVLESLMQLVFEQDSIIPGLVRKDHRADPAVYKNYLLNILRSPQQLRITTIDSFFTGILQAIPIELELGPQYTIYDEQEMAVLKDEFLQQFCEYLLDNDLFSLFRYFPYFSLNAVFFKSWLSSTQAQLMPVFDYLSSLPDFSLPLNNISTQIEPLLQDVTKLEKQLHSEIQAFHEALEKHFDDFSFQKNLQKHVLPKLSAFKIFPNLSSISIFQKESLHEHKWFEKGLSRHPEIETLFQSARSAAEKLFYKITYIKNVLYHYYAFSYINQWNTFLQEHNILTFDSIKMHVYNLGRQYQDASWDEKSLFINDLFFHLDGDIHHFLFDEFQDTDSFQWMFFWLLIEEFLSQDNDKSLYYVGDPKQSLYRFRGAVPELFDLVFKTLKQYSPASEMRSLDYNYRSDISLLRFFNDFFAFWSKQQPSFQYENQLKPEEESISSCQLTTGRRQLEKLPSLEIATIPPLRQIDDYEEEEDPFTVIVERIQQIFSQYHYRYHDMAVLSYTKGELKQIGALLKNADINYIIDDNPPFETYRSYHIITSVLSYLALRTPQSLLRAYYYYMFHPEYELTPNAVDSLITDTMLLGPEEVIRAFEKAGLHNVEESLRILEEKVDRVPLDSLTWLIITFFRLPPPLQDNQQHLKPRWEDEKLFLLDFLDFTHQYSQQHGYELMRFLGNLQLHPERFTTISRISANRIRLYTIHKSKGLQFPIVFYLYKPLSLKASSYEPDFVYFYQEKNTTNLPLPCQIPLQRITALKYPGTVRLIDKNFFSLLFFAGLKARDDIDREFYQEKMDTEKFMEEINKCYVACTRAQKGLYVFYQESARRQKELNLFAPYLEYKEGLDENNEKESAFQSIINMNELTSSAKSAEEEIPLTDKESAIPSLESYISKLPPDIEEPAPLKSDDIVSLGKLVHFLMQEGEFDTALSFQNARIKALRLWGYSLNTKLLNRALEIVQRIHEDERLTELYRTAREIRKEAYFIYKGKNYFLDCVFVSAEKVVIIDYKVTRISLESRQAENDRQKYFAQLQHYAKICRSYPDYRHKTIETYLLNIFASEPGYTWISGPQFENK